MALIASVRKVQLILRQLADDARRSFNLKDTNKEILIIGLRRATISPNVPLVLQESAICTWTVFALPIISCRHKNINHSALLGRANAKTLAKEQEVNCGSLCPENKNWTVGYVVSLQP
jgi:hypothetical protein